MLLQRGVQSSEGLCLSKSEWWRPAAGVRAVGGAHWGGCGLWGPGACRAGLCQGWLACWVEGGGSSGAVLAPGTWVWIS
jgi:hypothetical protein